MKVFSVQKTVIYAPQFKQNVGRDCHRAAKNNGTIKDVGIAMPTYVSVPLTPTLSRKGRGSKSGILARQHKPSKDKFVRQVSFGAVKPIPLEIRSKTFEQLEELLEQLPKDLKLKKITKAKYKETVGFIERQLRVLENLFPKVSDDEPDYFEWYLF